MTKRVVTSILLVHMVWAGVAAGERSTVSGIVRDGSGAPVGRAEVTLLDAQRVVVRAGETNAEGRFTIADVPPGRYVLLVTTREFEPFQRALAVESGAAVEAEVTLMRGSLREEVVVTAAPGVVQSPEELSQMVNVIDADKIAVRAHSVTAQVAAEEPGLHLQRTSPTIASIFVRGFTGSKVNVFVDGVRYSTGAMRGGINTFLNLLDPSFLSGVEVLRGPNSAQYGSDAIGGSVQFLTQTPVLSSGENQFGGGVSLLAGSADSSAGASLSGSFSSRKFGLVATVAGRNVNDLHPGEGVDSHNAVTRFLGLSSDVVIDDSLPDTSFTQYGGFLKFQWAISGNSRLVGSYLHSRENDGKRYDQLIGGDGNLVADLLDMTADVASLRYERTPAGWFDQISVGYSYNSQKEERVNQGGNGNPAASINHEPERTQAQGIQGLLTKFAGRHAASFGADAYSEEVDAPSYGVNPTTGIRSVRRGRVPDGATYKQWGVFVQDIFDVSPDRLKLNGSLRWAGARYRSRAANSPLVGGQPLWPDDELSVSSVTFRTGAVVTVTDGVQVTGDVSRGFRAPNITDLGTLGLTGAGFEVSAPEVSGLGAEVGSTADSSAVSTGRSVEQVDSETSMSYEAGMRVRRGRWDAGFNLFLTDVDQNITKQALILPPGAVGTTLGGETITSQNANGAVFVAASTNPVLVRANFDDARVTGAEYSLSVDFSPRVRFSSVGTYLRAEDRATGLPPNIEGGTPPPEGYLILRTWSRDRRIWVEPYVHLAARQTRVSSLDLVDRRTGAGRSQSSIASFFNNGARARGLVSSGPDGVPGNADDLLLATGETLAQVQARVLGPSLAANPLFPYIPGYRTLGVRGGISFGPSELLVDFENLTDENYRGPSWGMDAPGRGLFVRYAARF